MARTKSYTIPIYGIRFLLHACEDIQDDLIDFNVQSKNSNAVTLFEDNGKIHIFFSRNVDVGIIAHECKHAINMMYEHLGIKHDLENDEHECYLLGYFVNLTYKYLVKCNFLK